MPADPARSRPGACCRRRSARTSASRSTPSRARRRPRRSSPQPVAALEGEGVAALDGRACRPARGRCEHARRHPLRGPGVHADDPASTAPTTRARDAFSIASRSASTRRTRPATGTRTPARPSSSWSCARRRSATSGAPRRRQPTSSPATAAPLAAPPSSAAPRVTRDPRARPSRPRHHGRRAGHRQRADGDDGRPAGRHAVVDALGALLMRTSGGGLMAATSTPSTRSPPR